MLGAREIVFSNVAITVTGGANARLMFVCALCVYDLQRATK